MNQFRTELTTLEFETLKRELSLFNTRHPELFRILFQHNSAISYEGTLLSALKDTGLVVYEAGQWRSDYGIYTFGTQFFVTDSFTLSKQDRVLPLSADESLFLASQMNVRNGDTVLDIGTGSGIYAIIAAINAASVVAVDINEKALLYARFNAALNGVEHKIRFISSHVFESINNQHFDVIISNPAIIPTPAESGFYIHSDGGPDGADMCLNILKNFERYLSARGKLQMLITSFAKDDILLIEDFISSTFADTGLSFSIRELYIPALNRLTLLTDKFLLCKEHDRFVANFEQQGYSSLHYLYLTAERSSSFKSERKEKEELFEKDEYGGDWKGRLNRLFRVFTPR